MRKIGLSLIIILLFSASVLAANGIAVDPSRSIYGARPLGMGRAFVGISDDVNGMYFNPAGTTKIERLQITGTSRRVFFDETQYSLISFMTPVDIGFNNIGYIGHFGIGFVDANISGSQPTIRDPITGRITLNPSLEPISNDNNVLTLSYSRAISDSLSFGGNLKYYNQSLSGGGILYRGLGNSIDIAALWEPKEWIDVGLNLQNIASTGVKWNTSSEATDSLGGFTKIGMAVNVLGDKKTALYKNEHKLKIAFDIDLPRDILVQENAMLMHLGGEWTPPQVKDLTIRMGFDQDYGTGMNLSLGIGYKREGFGFDYAYYARGANLGSDNPHYFSLTYYGKPPKDPRKTVITNFVKTFTPPDRFITADRGIPVKGFVGIKTEVFMPQTIVMASPETKVITNEATGVTSYEIVTNQIIKHELKLITSEVVTIESLYRVSLNGIEMDVINYLSSFEGFYPSLEVGRNVLSFNAYTTPEGAYFGSGEVKVLLFEPFYDITMDYWAIEPIALISTLGYITGYPNYTFKPEKGITRAELVTLLIRSNRMNLEDPNNILFKDVASSHWAAAYINTGVKLGIVKGYPDNTFKPNRVLTRAEGVTIIARFAALASIKADEGSSPYPDLKESYWANVYIRSAKAAGMLSYLTDTFEPNKNFSRSEATWVLYYAPNIQRIVNLFWEEGLAEAKIQKKPVSETPTEKMPSTEEPAFLQTEASTAEVIEITTSEVIISTPTEESIFSYDLDDIGTSESISIESFGLPD